MNLKTWMSAIVICAASTLAAKAATSLAYRIPMVTDPGDPITVFVDMTSNRSNVAAVGARLTYDPTAVTLSSVAPGAGVPGSWSFVYQDTSVPGQIDFVLTDQTAVAAVVGTSAAREVLSLTFTRIGTNCNQSSFGFNAAAPAAGPATAAFPANHYAIYVAVDIFVETATVASATGPAILDNGFIRGNVNNRAAHTLDIQDAVDLIATLFGGFNPGFDCAAAFDVNNDGASNISDVIGLVQGVFGGRYTIPPPLAAPGIVDVDGGTIPSVLGCNQGEVCL